MGRLDRALQVSPFYTELPVYWKNCHRDPSKEQFQTQYIVNNRTKAMLEKIVKQCSNATVELLSARRIESSYVWTRYADFKGEVSSRLGHIQNSKDLQASAFGRLSSAFSRRPSIRRSFNVPKAHQGGPVRLLNGMAKEDFDCVLSTDTLEASLNECILWHGTSVSNAEAIAHVGFMISPSRVGNYGVGVYLAEDICKSLAYSNLNED